MTRFLRGIVVLGLLIVAGAAYSGRLGELRTPLTVLATNDQDATAAIQQVIQRSNDEQAQAIATRDSSVMADTVTSDHFQELVNINEDLLANGVASISLVKLEWGAVAVDGSTATATTYETWRTVFNNGTSDQSRERNEYALVLDSGTWRIQANTHPDQVSPPPPVALPDSRNTSHNWSGYAATGGAFSAVTGTWTVPDFSASGPAGVDATWVGIGGVRSRDLIQAGTQQTVSGSGSTQYHAWIEMLPRASRPVPLAVHAGDSVSVSLSEESADQWLFQFTNNTTGQTYQTTQQYTSSHSSAEWIEEAPSGGRGGVLPLDNFGTIQFSGASTVRNGQSVNIAGASARAITMLGSNDQTLAVPSGLGDDGASFSVARTDAPAGASSPRRRGFGAPFPIPVPGLGD